MNQYVQPTLKYINDEGKPEFEEEDRTPRQKKDIENIHKGIIQGFIGDKKATYGSIGMDFAGYILGFIEDEYSVKTINFLINNELKDYFCNRRFDIAEVIASLN